MEKDKAQKMIRNALNSGKRAFELWSLVVSKVR